MSAASSNERPPRKTPTALWCYLCKKWIANPGSFRLHMKSMHGANGTCPYCDRDHKDRPSHYDNIQKHITEYHEGQIDDYEQRLKSTLSDAAAGAAASIAELEQVQAANRNGKRVFKKSKKSQNREGTPNDPNLPMHLLEATGQSARNNEIAEQNAERIAVETLADLYAIRDGEYATSSSSSSSSSSSANSSSSSSGKRKGGKRRRTMNKNYKKTRRARKTRRTKKSKSRRH
jgi:hypothetical protein